MPSDSLKYHSIIFAILETIERGVQNITDVGHCPIFVAENGNLVHISADSDTKIVNETEISFSEGRRTEIVNIIVADTGKYRS